MVRDMELSTRDYERIILYKMSERLKMIRWGENCDSLIEALTFAEAWLAEGISSFEEIQKFRDYLISEGFTMKGERLYGKEIISWRFPSKPKNMMFVKILKDFSKSYNNESARLKSKAYEEIVKFIESEEYVRDYSIENSIFKKELLFIVGEYNQHLMREKNTLREGEVEYYLDYRMNKSETAMFISKECEFQGFVTPDGSTPDKYSVWMEMSEGTYKMLINNVLKLFLCIANSVITGRAYCKVYTKYVISIAPNCFQGLKEAFKPYGIKVSKLPAYPEAEYFNVRKTGAYEIPLYIEVLKINPQSDEYPVKELQAFCDGLKH